MEFEIVTRSSFAVVGLKYTGTEHNEIPKLWSSFLPRLQEFQNAADLSVCYGVCCDTQVSGTFDYIAGVEVKDLDSIPSGMVVYHIPTQTYAVFACYLRNIETTFMTANACIPRNLMWIYCVYMVDRFRYNAEDLKYEYSLIRSKPTMRNKLTFLITVLLLSMLLSACAGVAAAQSAAPLAQTGDEDAPSKPLRTLSVGGSGIAYLSY